MKRGIMIVVSGKRAFGKTHAINIMADALKAAGYDVQTLSPAFERGPIIQIEKHDVTIIEKG